MSSERIFKRYSFAFKQKVVSEIESGKLSIEGARRRYDIGGKNTIPKWLRQFGKGKYGKVVRIEMADEVDRLKVVEKEKQELESALARAYLKIEALESLLEAASRQLGIDIKKNFDTRESRSCEQK
ncbi:MAG: transposase [candidate division Zixibacteria bacterium]|nr:transposase [candidate division Zixibacteria bacterium]NIW41380.1 transposase [candidate division Zixibacteria bacterium]NIX55114.1 transposase [candidate division Zixibacteria bacterium]